MRKAYFAELVARQLWSSRSQPIVKMSAYIQLEIDSWINSEPDSAQISQL